MIELSDFVITEIYEPFTVQSPRGKRLEQNGRKKCGISFCLGGQIQYLSDGACVESDDTCAVFLPRGANYTLIGKATGRFPLINFDCLGEVGNRVLAFPLSDPTACIRQFETIKDLFLLQGTRAEIFAAFYRLLQLVSGEKKPKNSRLQKAIDYVREHLTEPELSNRAVADALGISEVYLRKLFQRELNTTPKQYILGLRLAKAKHLLCHSGFTVTRISEECGFSCVYHFCRCFKNKVGCSPREFAGVDRTLGEGEAIDEI